LIEDNSKWVGGSLLHLREECGMSKWHTISKQLELAATNPLVTGGGGISGGGAQRLAIVGAKGCCDGDGGVTLMGCRGLVVMSANTLAMGDQEAIRLVWVGI
jgi:hypothetical protein